jgi:hypothetical protein
MGGMNWLFREPRRDPELGSALSRMEGDLDARDIELLRQRIVTAARPSLARLRAPESTPRWWEWITRWMPVAVPVGLAALLAGGLLVPGGSSLADLGGYSAEVSSDSTLVLAAYAEPGTAGQLTTHLVAPETPGWLLEQVYGQ